MAATARITAPPTALRIMALRTMAARRMRDRRPWAACIRIAMVGVAMGMDIRNIRSTGAIAAVIAGVRAALRRAVTRTRIALIGQCLC